MKTIIVLLLAIITTSAAHAHHYRRALIAPSAVCWLFCDASSAQSASARPNRRGGVIYRRLSVPEDRLEPAGRVWAGEASHRSAGIVPNPAGCPRVAFCGCGASVRLFGRSVRELWLAANWLKKFPRAAPAPGMAAVRQHHVMVLEARGEHGGWVVYDANSGGHATRIHERSLTGYVIVDPSALAMSNTRA
jgi:hypothetical protein